MVKYFIYKFGQFMVNILPLKVSYRIAMCMSDIQYYFSWRDRRAVRNNLRAFAPDNANIERLTKDVFRNFGKYLVEFFGISLKFDEHFIEKNIRIENIEALEDTLRHGKGAILITGHLGNWELGAMVLSFLGYPMVAIALPHKERPVNDLFNYQRQRRGITIIPNSIAVRRCLETLKENKLIAMVADRDFTNSGEAMEFLNKKTMIPKGPAIFSFKTGAPIIPASIIRQKDDSFVLMIGEPVYPPAQVTGEITKEQLQGLIKGYLTQIEGAIRQHPSQWLMFRQYWI